ncbi:SHOCT domain-containing protein [Novacetimonas sp. GS1]|uniref:SHOCT domain-containing protein n=1 Tax=Novacetimonas sp. GS1 TaxID=3119990 RepID=UPI002FCCBA7C
MLDVVIAMRGDNAARLETVNTAPDLVSQLSQLAKLKEVGVLSQEEFDTAKRRLIAG